MGKSLNQLYKESGTTLSYKEWRRREDDKMASFGGTIPPINLSDSDSFKNTQKEMEAIGGYKTDISKKTTFGIPNYVLVIGGVLVIGAISFSVYSKYKSK